MNFELENKSAENIVGLHFKCVMWYVVLFLF